MNRRHRIALALHMDLRDLWRRPLILVLLVATPITFITVSIARTEPIPRTLQLAGGTTVVTTMREIHGANMALIAVAFLAGLVGVFIMTAARQADARLVRAGFDAAEVVLARIGVLLVCTILTVIVSLAVTAQGFTPQHWIWFAVGTTVVGVTYAGFGALASATLGRIGATYLLLFSAMLDLGIVQNPMFGSGTPPRWAMVLPGYPGSRAVMDAALSHSSTIPYAVLAGSIAWMAAVLGVTVWRLTRDLRPTT